MTEESAPKRSSIIKAQMSVFSILRLDCSMEDIDRMCGKFWSIPLSGMVFGIILGLVFMVCNFLFTPAVASIITVFLSLILTRFLHFDGLMDLGDGLVAHGDPEKKIRALKDSNVGAGAVGVALMTYMLMTASLSACFTASSPALKIYEDSYFFWFLAAFMFPLCAEVLAKNGLFIAAAFGESAQTGFGAHFTNVSFTKDIPKSILISSVIVIPAVLLVMFDFSIGVSGALIMAVLMIAASCVTGYAVSRIAMKSFGFVNGDALGAANELSKTAVYLMGLMVLTVMA